MAVANGSGTGLRQHLGADPFVRGGTMQPGQRTVSAQATARLFHLAFHRTRLETFVPAGRGGTGTVYSHTRRRCFVFCDTDIVFQSPQTFQNPYEIVAGSYDDAVYNVLGRGDGDWNLRDDVMMDGRSLLNAVGALQLLLGVNLSASMAVEARRHTFIPTLSALDYNATNLSRSSLLSSIFLDQLLEQPVNRAQTYRTPFDDVYVAGDQGDAARGLAENQFHLSLTPGIQSFVLSHLNQPIPNRAIAPLAVSISGPAGRSAPSNRYGT